MHAPAAAPSDVDHSSDASGSSMPTSTTPMRMVQLRGARFRSRTDSLAGPPAAFMAER